MEDRAASYDAIASACSREFIPCDAEQLHPVEHPQAHFVISKLLKSDAKFDIKLGDFIVKQCINQISSWVILFLRYSFSLSYSLRFTFQEIFIAIGICDAAFSHSFKIKSQNNICRKN